MTTNRQRLAPIIKTSSQTHAGSRDTRMRAWILPRPLIPAVLLASALALILCVTQLGAAVLKDDIKVKKPDPCSPKCLAGACTSSPDGPVISVLKLATPQMWLKAKKKQDYWEVLTEVAKEIAQLSPLDNPSGSRTTFVFPPGTYHIEQTSLVGPVECGYIPATYFPGGDRSIHFSGIQNVNILGCGSTIDVKGDFDRGTPVTPEQVPGQGPFPEQINPFYFENSHNFRLQGFEIDGNVGSMRRPHAPTPDFPCIETTPGVAPAGCPMPGCSLGWMTQIEGEPEGAGGYGIYTTNCQNYELFDLHVHHMSVDGVYLGGGGGYQVDTNAHLTDVVSEYNSRDALAVGAVHGATVKHSKFNKTGLNSTPSCVDCPEQAYGFLQGAAGVDIEPAAGDPAVWGTYAQDIQFDSCEFRSNLGRQFTSNVGNPPHWTTDKLGNLIYISEYTDLVKDVTLNRCTFAASPYRLSPDQVVFGGHGNTVTASQFKLRDGYIQVAEVNADTTIGSADPTVPATNIYSSGRGVYIWNSDSVSNSQIIIQNTNFFGSYSFAANNGGTDPWYFPMILSVASAPVQFTGNTLFLSQSAFSGQDGQQVGLFWGDGVFSSGNTFETDLGFPNFLTTSYFTPYYGAAHVTADHYVTSGWLPYVGASVGDYSQ